MFVFCIFYVSALNALDRSYITPFTLKKSAIIGNIQNEVGLPDKVFIQWLSAALEDRNYNAAIKTIHNFPKFEKGMNTKEANEMLMTANEYLQKSSKSANKKVALISASTGIMLSGLFYTLSKERKNPYVLDYLKVYQKNDICYGYIVEANIISSYKYTKHPDYARAFKLLDKAKTVCDSKKTPTWEKNRRNSLEILLQERYKLIKDL